MNIHWTFTWTTQQPHASTEDAPAKNTGSR
jgi:hypothetical protein